MDARPQGLNRSIAAHIRWLRKQLAKLNAALEQAIRRSPLWSQKARSLRSVPAIGSVTVTYAAGPSTGTRHAQPPQDRGLVGVVPFNHDSGKLRGIRAIWGGRVKFVRCFIRLPLVATRHNPLLQGFYVRLLAAGKKPKVALTACMRKFLIMLNAILRHQLPWNPEFAARRPCILPPESTEKSGTGCASSKSPGPSEAVG